MSVLVDCWSGAPSGCSWPGDRQTLLGVPARPSPALGLVPGLSRQGASPCPRVRSLADASRESQSVSIREQQPVQPGWPAKWVVLIGLVRSLRHRELDDLSHWFKCSMNISTETSEAQMLATPIATPADTILASADGGCARRSCLTGDIGLRPA